MDRTLIMLGGVYNIALIVFHLMFWRLFDWPEDLRSLTSLNRSVMQVLNISIMGIFAIFAFVSLVHPDELLSTALGRSLLAGMALLWAGRAVQQVIFFKLRTWASRMLFGFFALGGALYAVPLLA